VQSHRFHGKGLGNMKIAKRLRNIKEEEMEEATWSAGYATQHEYNLPNSAGDGRPSALCVVCGAVPQAVELFDSPPLSKSEADKQSRNAKANAQAVHSITLPVSQSQANATFDNLSPAPSGFSSLVPNSDTGSDASTGVKSKFIEISSAVNSSSRRGTPVPTERHKVAFAFGTNRKAGDGVQGSPPPKRQ